MAGPAATESAEALAMTASAILYGSNQIICGGGEDEVVTNQQSEVADSCEKVTRW